MFFGVCVLTDLSSLLTKGSASMEQERQLRKLIGLRDWMMAVLAFPVGVVSTVHPFICLLTANKVNHIRGAAKTGLVLQVCTKATSLILLISNGSLF